MNILLSTKKLLYSLFLALSFCCTLSINKLSAQKYKNADIKSIPVFFPVDKKGFSRISSKFGYRWHPIKKKKIFHKGIDLAAKAGSRVYASAYGIVFESSYSKSYGNYIIIQHRNGYRTKYAHLSKRFVNKYQRVQQGSVIGSVGSTGHSTGPHLHFELIRGNKNIDPYAFWMKAINR